jgi:hypothetical protein
MECSEVRDDMLDVLYGEASPAVARRVEAHQAACGACRAEMESLATTRKTLQAWRLPEARRHRSHDRGWAWRPLAAAAGLVLAFGAGLGVTGSTLRYEEGRISLRLGKSGDADVKSLLQGQEQRHQQEIAALRASLPLADSGSGTRVLAQVRDMIRESEARQAVLLSSSLQDQADESDRQRRYDMARVSAGLSYLDERNGKHVAQTTELMGYVLQAAEKK